MNIQENRKNLIKAIIDLHNYFIVEWSKNRNTPLNKDSLWNKELIDLKFDRYHLVEHTTHNEEDFKVQMEVRYTLRSKEANAYGDGHDAFYKRYLSTIAFSLDDIQNPEKYKVELQKQFDEFNKPVTEKV